MLQNYQNEKKKFYEARKFLNDPTKPIYLEKLSDEYFLNTKKYYLDNRNFDILNNLVVKIPNRDCDYDHIIVDLIIGTTTFSGRIKLKYAGKDNNENRVYSGFFEDIPVVSCCYHIIAFKFYQIPVEVSFKPVILPDNVAEKLYFNLITHFNTGDTFYQGLHGNIGSELRLGLPNSPRNLHNFQINHKYELIYWPFYKIVAQDNSKF